MITILVRMNQPRNSSVLLFHVRRLHEASANAQHLAYVPCAEDAVNLGRARQEDACEADEHDQERHEAQQSPKDRRTHQSHGPWQSPTQDVASRGGLLLFSETFLPARRSVSKT